jgi:hypothetical protein
VNVETVAPLWVSVAVSWKIAETAWIDAGAAAVVETTVTAVEPETSPVPKETTAWPSALAALPPEVGVTRAEPAGGDGPLPGFDAGSGGAGVTPVGIVAVAPAPGSGEPDQWLIVPGVVVAADPAPSAGVPALSVGASPEFELSVVAGGCPTLGAATVPTLLDGEEVETVDGGAVAVGVVTARTGGTRAVVGWTGTADAGELVGAGTTGSVSCAGEEIWTGGGDEIAGAGVVASTTGVVSVVVGVVDVGAAGAVSSAGEVSPASCNERNSCAPVPALRPDLAVDGSAAGSVAGVEGSVAGTEGSGVDAEGSGTGVVAVAGGVVSAGSAGGGPPTVSSTTPASCCTAVAAALTSTGEPTESSTTVAFVSAAAATAARPLVANGTAGFAAAAADGDSSEYVSDTTGTRCVPPPVRAPVAGAVRAAAGSAGGACSFGTVSGGNHARPTFKAGIEETAAYAGMRSALTIGVTYRLSTDSSPIATSQYRTPRRRRPSNE